MKANSNKENICYKVEFGKNQSISIYVQTNLIYHIL